MAAKVPSPSVADRVEQALARAGAGLRLWVVFDTAEDAAAAKALLAARKVRHVEALSRSAWQAREAEAYARLAARVAAPAPAAVTTAPAEPEAPAPTARKRRAGTTPAAAVPAANPRAAAARRVARA